VKHLQITRREKYCYYTAVTEKNFTQTQTCLKISAKSKKDGISWLKRLIRQED
jgi:hypothetical protein